MLAGRPLVWYAHHGVGFAMYIPCSAAGALVPYLLASELAARDALLGLALLFGGMASLLTSCGLGSSFLLAMWALSACVGAPRRSQARLPPGERALLCPPHVQGCNFFAL